MAGFESWLYTQAPSIVILVAVTWAIVVKGWLNTHTHILDLKTSHKQEVAQLEKRIDAAERNAALWQDIARPAVETARRAVDVASVPVTKDE